MTMTSVDAGEARWNKPVPNIDKDSEEFWAGLARHEFLLWTCGQCGAQYWPKSFCINHSNEPFAKDMSWRPASGNGTLFAFNVHHWAFHPGFRDDVPYTYALIELAEGPLISSTIVGRQPTAADVGQPVTVVYEDHPEAGFTLPRFSLTDSPAADSPGPDGTGQ
jgi:uncharacterized OB-fold protein